MTSTITAEQLIDQLRQLASPETLAGQQRFAIRGGGMLGVSIYDLRKLAKGIRDHDLALELWASGIHEARILASLIDEPHKVNAAQMQAWAEQFDSWDICDVVTDELFIHAPGILDLIPRWAASEEEYVKRAAFASIAAITVHSRQIDDNIVRSYFALIESAALDERNFVKKSVNWALRNIGKFRPALRQEAVECALRLLKLDTKSARWIAKDALREFKLKFGGEYEV